MMIWPTPIVTERTVMERRQATPVSHDMRVERVDEVVAATDHEGGKGGQGGQPGQGGAGGDRRQRPGGGPPDNRALFDAVIAEMQQAAPLEEGHADRLRLNLRAFMGMGAAPLPENPTAADLVARLAPDHPALSAEERAENARLASALHQCLALHTEGAQKIAVYLHALLAQGREGHRVEITV